MILCHCGRSSVPGRKIGSSCILGTFNLPGAVERLNLRWFLSVPRSLSILNSSISRYAVHINLILRSIYTFFSQSGCTTTISGASMSATSPPALFLRIFRPILPPQRLIAR